MHPMHEVREIESGKHSHAISYSLMLCMSVLIVPSFVLQRSPKTKSGSSVLRKQG
jgi:hypothetical protein